MICERFVKICCHTKSDRCHIYSAEDAARIPWLCVLAGDGGVRAEQSCYEELLRSQRLHLQ